MLSSHPEPLSTSSSVNLQQDDEKVWLAGVEGFDADERASSVHGAQASICKALGEPLSYQQLICYGGLAFRLQTHEAMCPSAAHPGPGFMCLENSNRALPWTVRSVESFPWSAPVADREAFERDACAAIRQSIDRGIPVHYGSEEDGLIIGYGEEGRRWWCLHPYHGGGREAFWHDQVQGFAGGKWPWCVGVWIEPKPADGRASARDLTIAALKQAVEMWRTEKRGDYYVGDAGYAHWLKWLEDVEAGRIADPRGGMQGNGWCYATLIHYRRHAAQWLRAVADEFDAGAAEALATAADHYAALAETCAKDLECPWSLAPGSDRYDHWTSAMRRDQITRLQAAHDHDRAAIAAIAKAMG